jgi:dipeptidyl aminopeptidase/acylaminoacyl peptidase
MYRPSRRFRPLSLLAAAVLSFAACNGDDSPLAPTGAGPVPPADPGQVEAVAPADAALITAQRIAFLSPRNGVLSVYKMDPAGNNVVRLTKTSDPVYGPAWSYDNKRIAVMRDRWEGTVSREDIWLVNADGTNGHWLRNTLSPFYLKDPSWAPNGSHLLVSIFIAPSYWYLGKIEVASGTITLLYPSGGGIVGDQPSYDKAGKRIVYRGASHATLDQVNTDGSGHKVLYNSGGPAVDLPRFSPDGGRIVFQKGPAGGNTDVFVKNLGTGVVTKLTSSTAPDGLATWSPDGTKLAFLSGRLGPAQIYTMSSSTGGSLTRITHTGVSEGAPVWTH